MEKIKVNDMSCMHCVQKIQKALLSNNVEASIDLSNHEVTVSKDNLTVAIQSIKDAGYTPEV